MINNEYEKTIGGTKSNFIDFIKSKNIFIDSLDEETINSDIEFLTQRIAQNMFYYENNINTAKTDYLCLIKMLIKKGVIFK